MCDHCDQTLYLLPRNAFHARTNSAHGQSLSFPGSGCNLSWHASPHLAGLKTVFSFGPKISAAVAAKPEGLLLHENVFFPVYPLHIGMRQYWRDFPSLENWARSLPHQEWWQEFLRDSGGVGFWHETYFMRGGMEAIYDDLKAPVGFSVFAPNQPAQGPDVQCAQTAWVIRRSCDASTSFRRCSPNPSLISQRFDRIEIGRTHSRKHRADHAHDRQNTNRDEQGFRSHDQANVARLGMLGHGAIKRQRAH